MHESDEDLVRACQRGDAAAWETLVNRYQRLVFSIPRRSGLSEELSAEVFQQVFATLVEQLPNIRQPGRIKAWLVTSARREAWRVSRQERRTLPFAGGEQGDGGEGHIPDGEPLPDEMVIRLEEQHEVYTAVQALDDRCRDLLTMLFYDRETPSYAEIAARLGTPEGSIGPTRARCLQKLRRILLEQGA